MMSGWKWKRKRQLALGCRDHEIHGYSKATFCARSNLEMVGVYQDLIIIVVVCFLFHQLFLILTKFWSRMYKCTWKKKTCIKQIQRYREVELTPVVDRLLPTQPLRRFFEMSSFFSSHIHLHIHTYAYISTQCHTHTHTHTHTHKAMAEYVRQEEGFI